MEKGASNEKERFIDVFKESINLFISFFFLSINDKIFTLSTCHLTSSYDRHDNTTYIFFFIIINIIFFYIYIYRICIQRADTGRRTRRSLPIYLFNITLVNS